MGIFATILSMVEKDVVDEVRAAAAERNVATERLKRAVIRAALLGYPKAKLARDANVHRNTVYNWIAEAQQGTKLPKRPDALPKTD